MRKLLFTLLVFPVFTYAQDSQSQKFENGVLTTTSGFKVEEGQKIKIGSGSMPDGDFKYIRRSATSMFTYHSTTGYQGLANQANSFPRSNAGLEFKVVRIDERGNKKHGYVYYPIINSGIVRFEIDIDNAIQSGEIIVPDEFKPKNSASSAVVVKQEVSVADELAKMKKLYDDGVLTKEEFEAQKKKLLEKN